MTKQTAVKNIIWALCIGVALLALLVGLFTVAVARYSGEKARPVMDIGASVPKSASVKTAGGESEQGTAADGTLHTLTDSRDAGQSYLDKLCFLCDSRLVALKSSGLVSGQVWIGEDRRLPMGSASSWRVIYPGDGSLISPASAAMIAKPTLLVIAVGGDEAAAISREGFIAGYEQLISSILSSSADTRIVCGEVLPVTAAYAGAEGPSPERAEELNEWLRQVCTDTGAFYAEWSSALTDGVWLRPEYAQADGRSLGSAGLSALLGWLRTHASSI